MQIKSGHFYISKYNTSFSVNLESDDGKKVEVALSPHALAELVPLLAKYSYESLVAATKTSAAQLNAAALDEIQQFAPANILEHAPNA